MTRLRLGVNIDHIATLRQARGTRGRQPRTARRPVIADPMTRSPAAETLRGSCLLPCCPFMLLT